MSTFSNQDKCYTVEETEANDTTSNPDQESEEEENNNNNNDESDEDQLLYGEEAVDIVQSTIEQN